MTGWKIEEYACFLALFPVTYLYTNVMICKLKKLILEASLDLNMFKSYCLLVFYEKKSFILIYVVFFCSKNPKFYIADTWL